ncbi:AMP-binding protein [Albidovulum sediminicola]|uniref:AMP-binding protein n=1 Tax=Albidovulum sediminicola TaxID=2984331 RepID=UPI0021E78E45|nr:AMP-binding protein [Defluviimonas sp. WL0075]
MDAAELLTRRAAKMSDAGIGSKKLMREASQIKRVATETAAFRSDRAFQIPGGDGVTRQYGRVEQLCRDARATDRRGNLRDMQIPDRRAGNAGDPPKSLTLRKRTAMHIARLLEASAARCPDHIALVFEGRRWTYAEWLGRARRFAQALSDLGVRRGDRVAFYVTTSGSSVITCVACPVPGAIAVPIQIQEILFHPRFSDYLRRP